MDQVKEYRATFMMQLKQYYSQHRGFQFQYFIASWMQMSRHIYIIILALGNKHDLYKVVDEAEITAKIGLQNHVPRVSGFV